MQVDYAVVSTAPSHKCELPIVSGSYPNSVAHPTPYLHTVHATGWDKVTCQQLKSMLESCASPDQALRLLLRNSRSHPVNVGKEAEAKQGRQGQAATAGEASDGETGQSKIRD